MAYSSKKQTKYLRGYLFEKFFDGHVLFRVFLHNLGHSHLKVLLSNVDSSFPEGVHTSLCANRSNFGAGRVGAKSGEEFPSDITLNKFFSLPLRDNLVISVKWLIEIISL